MQLMLALVGWGHGNGGLGAPVFVLSKDFYARRAGMFRAKGMGRKQDLAVGFVAPV